MNSTRFNSGRKLGLLWTV